MDQLHTDVVVVGGGSSGVSAAIAAAREGARVVLVEDDGLLGGTAVDYGVQGFSPGIVCGINQEIRDILAQRDYTFRHTKKEFCSHWYAFAVSELAGRESTLTVLPHSTAIGAVQQGGCVGGVVVQTRSGHQAGYTQRKILAKVVIDCSGDADIAFAAGCEYRYGREAREEFNEPHAPESADARVQQCTWMYKSRRLDPATTWRPDFDYNRDIGYGEYLHWGCQVDCDDTTDPSSLRRAEQAAWAAMLPNFETLERNGFAVTQVAPRLGVRESRRIVGEVMVTENDCTEGRRFADAITSSNRGLDSWEPENKKIFYGRSKMYDIPYRALVPKAIDGLLVAGRCLSATHIAISGFRVMVTVSSIGQAAGIAAAMAAQRNQVPREVDVRDLQGRLESPRHHVIWSKHREG